MLLRSRNITSMNNIQYDNDINKLIYVLLDSAQKMPQMIFVYFLIVSHFDALVVRFNKCSRRQGFENKGKHLGEPRGLALFGAGEIRSKGCS